MSENALYQQLGKFVVLFQRLENSLIEITTLIADPKDYEVVQILLTEIEYRRLVESTDVLFSYFVDLLRQPDAGAKDRFHSLMNRCSALGTLRNRLIHSTYAHLVKDGNVVALVQEKPKLKFKGGGHVGRWTQKIYRLTLLIRISNASLTFLPNWSRSDSKSLTGNILTYERPTYDTSPNRRK